MISELAMRLQRTRTLGGISSRELSDLCGFSPTLIGQLERGDTADLVTARAAKVAHVLGVELDWLINGEGQAPVKGQVRAAIDRARTENEQASEAPKGAA